MPKDVTQSLLGALKLMAWVLAAFLGWYLNSYILTMQQTVGTNKTDIAVIREKLKYAEREIERLRLPPKDF